MGNRAVITTKENFENNGVGIYVHYCGDLESIEAFLTYCKIIGARQPEDDDYGWATLSRVIGNYFGDTTGIGINVINQLDTINSDNGTYIIKDWQVVDRYYSEGLKSNITYEELIDKLLDIDSCQPKPLGLTEIKKRYNELFS